MRDVAAGKTAKDEKTKFQGRRIVRGGEIAANRVHALLSKMFQLAEDWNFGLPAPILAEVRSASRSTRSNDTYQ